MPEPERLLKEKERLQQAYDELNEKISYLQELYIRDGNSGEKGFSLKKQIEKAESELDEIDAQINSVECRINDLNIYKIFESLLDLDCKEHIERFIEFITPHQTGAFFIHGSAKYSPRFLLKRLLQEISYGSMEQPIVINLPSTERRYGSVNNFNIKELLWDELGRKIGMRRRPSHLQIVERLSKKRKTQNITIVLDELDCRYDLNDIIENFWAELVDNTEQSSNYFLMVLLIDEFTYLSEYDQDFFFENYNTEWSYHIPVKLPMIGKFVNDDLVNWIKWRARGIFHPSIKAQVTKIVEEILLCCDDGSPDNVIEYICTNLCQCEFDEGVLKEWLKF